MVKDTVSNAIIKIKNANFAKKDVVSVEYSKYIDSILTLLEKEGYIASFSKNGKKIIKTADVVLKYDEKGKPVIQGFERISKLSKRTYSGFKDIKPVRHGFGIVVISSPIGVITGIEARKKKVGGEVLFKIW